MPMSSVRSVAASRTAPLMISPAPAVVDAKAGDDVADQCGVQRAVAVDDQHAAVAWLGQHRLEQCVVLKAPHGGDRSRELGPAAVLGELQVAASDVGADLVDEVSGGARLDGHRSMLAIGPVSSFGSMWARA